MTEGEKDMAGKQKRRNTVQQAQIKHTTERPTTTTTTTNGKRQCRKNPLALYEYSVTAVKILRNTR